MATTSTTVSRLTTLASPPDRAEFVLVEAADHLGDATALVRFLESRLFGVAPFEPTIWGLSAAGLVLIVFAAALLPARLAARLDPVETLREP